MRILVINRSPFGYLIDALKFCQYASRNHDLAYLSFDSGFAVNSATAVPDENITIYTVPRLDSWLRRTSQWFSRCFALSGRDQDIVYVYYFPGCSLLPLLKHGRRFVLDVRTASVSRSRVRRLLQNSLLSIEARAFARVHVISDGVAATLRLNPAATRVVPLGADPVIASRRPDPAPKLIYIGTLTAERRLIDTIEGFAQFWNAEGRDPSASYTLLGTGPAPDVERLRRYIATAGLSGVVRLEGYVPHAKAQRYLDACTIGVSYVPITPYFNHQPPTKTFEYLSAGIPVVATATAAHKGIVNETNGVLIADSAQAFHEGLKRVTNRLTQYCSRTIQASVATYSWESIVKEQMLPSLYSLVR